MKTIKAVALISGGLDSMLAAKVIQAQGVHVEGINFYTGFCHSGHTSAIRNQKDDKPKRNDALWVAEQLDMPLHIIDIVEEYKEVLTNPQHGYGQFLNPCLDCKIFMMKKAYEWMQENDFDFIITGEVVGQRPKSQRKECMPMVAKNSGAEDRLLRPLCALNLPETLPEQEGWVDRNKLFDFHGRGRKGQIALANDFGFDEYAQPAGGCCVLTDENYSRKLQDLWEIRGNKKYDLDDIIMLKVGRHLRPKPNYKIIVGRDEGENNFLEGYRKQFIHMRALDLNSPLVFLDGEPTSDDVDFAARVTGRFSAGRDLDSVRVIIVYPDGRSEEKEVTPLPKQEVKKEWYL